MFHFPSNNPHAYLSYDARRSALEQDDLIRKQSARRQAEELALYRQQRQAHSFEDELELAYAQEMARRLEQRQQLEQYNRYEQALQQRAEEQARFEEEQALRRRLQQQQETQFAHAHGHCTCHSRAATPSQPIRITIHSRSGSPSFTPSPTPTHTPAPEPATIAPKETPQETPEQIEAAAVLQRHFRAHLERRQKLASLQSLLKTFKARQSTFILPTTLSFQAASNSSSTSAHDDNHKLAFSSLNASFLAYEDFLVRLLSSADAIQSGGDQKVKERRRALVSRVEKELLILDEAKEIEWRRQNVGDSTVDIEPEIAPATESTSIALNALATTDTVDEITPTVNAALDTADPLVVKDVIEPGTVVDDALVSIDARIATESETGQEEFVFA